MLDAKLVDNRGYMGNPFYPYSIEFLSLWIAEAIKSSPFSNFVKRVFENVSSMPHLVKAAVNSTDRILHILLRSDNDTVMAQD